MINKDEIDKHVIMILLEMKNRNLLMEDVYDPDADKILIRNEATENVVKKIHDVVQKNWEEYKKDIGKYGFTEQDVMQNHFVLASHMMLARSEALKRFLLSILNKNQTVNNEKINPGDEYGKLIGKLSRMISYPDFETLFNPELRNALAHDEWWTENNFVYFRNKDRSITKYTFAQFMDQLVQINQVTIFFVHRYMENHRVGARSSQYNNLLNSGSIF